MHCNWAILLLLYSNYSVFFQYKHASINILAHICLHPGIYLNRTDGLYTSQRACVFQSPVVSARLLSQKIASILFLLAVNGRTISPHSQQPWVLSLNLFQTHGWKMASYSRFNLHLPMERLNTFSYVSQTFGVYS